MATLIRIFHEYWHPASPENVHYLNPGVTNGPASVLHRMPRRNRRTQKPLFLRMRLYAARKSFNIYVPMDD